MYGQEFLLPIKALWTLSFRESMQATLNSNPSLQKSIFKEEQIHIDDWHIHRNRLMISESLVSGLLAAVLHSTTAHPFVRTLRFQ